MIIDTTLYNSDCFSVLRTMPDDTIDLILTDPPYLISRKTNFSNGGGNEKKFGSIKMDFGGWDNEEFDMKTIIAHYKRILRYGGTMIIFFDIFKMQSIYNIAVAMGFRQPRIGIWDKANAVPINASINYLSNCREYFISFTKGKKKVFNSYYDKAYYSFPIVSGRERTMHPTQKPIRLMEELIKVNSNKGDVVLDSFMGSGTTGVAAINMLRKFIGIELNPEYYSIAKARIDESLLRRTSSLF